MVLIKDLGICLTKKGNKKHYGLYVCPVCKNPWKVAHERVSNKLVSRCKSCAMTKHGLSDEPLYYIWKNMISRCYNKEHPSYKHYGEYGVTVCEEWRNSPKSFIEWSKQNGYRKGLHLDKDADNDLKVYSPATCSFIERLKNNQATRKLKSTNTSGFRGVSYSKVCGKWLSQITVDYKHTVIGYFNSKIEAAKAYDFYVISNNLSHTVNGVLNEGEKIELGKPLKPTNTSGYTGVSYSKSREKWVAYITIDKKRKHIGQYSTAEEAAFARASYLKQHKGQ